jgi:hypothetical protein
MGVRVDEAKDLLYTATWPSAMLATNGETHTCAVCTLYARAGIEQVVSSRHASLRCALRHLNAWSLWCTFVPFQAACCRLHAACCMLHVPSAAPQSSRRGGSFGLLNRTVQMCSPCNKMRLNGADDAA